MRSDTEIDHENLRHMLGIQAGRDRRSWGFRNHYAAELPDVSMQRLLDAKLVEQGRQIEGASYVYFHATKAGCRAVGMTDAEIAKMEPVPHD